MACWRISRLGRVDLAVGVTNLDEVLRDVLASLQITLEEQRVSVRVPQPLPSLCCDQARVGEVFRNLIANAVKYNDKADKLVEIGFVMPDDPAQPILVFFIRDNGIGIFVKVHHENSLPDIQAPARPR